MQPENHNTSNTITEIVELRHTVIVYKSSNGYIAAVLRMPCGRRIVEEERATVAEAIEAAANKLNL